MTVLQNGTFTGFRPDLLQAMSKVGGFTYSISAQSDNAYGAALPGGGWNGMVGSLLAGVGCLA